MSGLTDILRMVTVATIAMFLTISGFDRSAAAFHDVENAHNENSAATPSSDHSDPAGSSCHGVLLCLAAIEQAGETLSKPASMRRLRNRKHSNHLSHLAHLVFDPPPPRNAV